MSGYNPYDEQEDFTEEEESQYEKITQKEKMKKAVSGKMLIFIQIISCVFILAAAVILKTVGGPIYETAKQWYLKQTNDTIIVDIPLEKLFDSSSSSEIENSSLPPVSESSSPTSSAPLSSAQDVSENTSPVTDLSVTAERSVQTYSSQPQQTAWLSATLQNPLEDGVITSVYGERDGSFHKGLDIAAPAGTGIHSTLSGTVTTAETSDSYGNYIVIDHGNNLKTLYAHCSELLVQAGDSVKRGDLIAKVGETGDATGNHLHLELLIHGCNFDPEPVLNEGYPYAGD